MAKRKSAVKAPPAEKKGRTSPEDFEKKLRGSTEAVKKKLRGSPEEVVKKLRTSPEDAEARFVGDPIPAEEARRNWPERYKGKGLTVPSNELNDSKQILQAICHFSQAVVDGYTYNLYDDVFVKADEGKPHYIAKILEFFQGTDKDLYFYAKWYYRGEDTVIKEQSNLIDKRRVFFSDVRDDNPLDCIISKVKILQISTNLDPLERDSAMSEFDFYYDMDYSPIHCSFTTPDKVSEMLKTSSDATMVRDSTPKSTTQGTSFTSAKVPPKVVKSKLREMTLLDLYSGCGAMSTGLCLGAARAGSKLVTKWALDINQHACESLKINHPETQVRNESADDFLSLLKEWERLCQSFDLLGSAHQEDLDLGENKSDIEDESVEEGSNDGTKVAPQEFEVEKLLAVCFGDPNSTKSPGLHFKVRWKGYGPSDDTWEPIDCLSNCTDALRDFAKRGIKENILPLPGKVDFICGGPPCQGMSGFNRFRETTDPLKDPKNSQLIVYMNTVEFLKPRYVLMENVVDIVKLCEGILGCYSIGRLVSMNYQARVGILAAGSFGACQCRMRFFLWGAQKMEKLPQFPLPTHEFVGKGVTPVEFKEHNVAFEVQQLVNLEKSVVLGDVISDLPQVTNYEDRDAMPYDNDPLSDFQRHIRAKKPSSSSSETKLLYDHIPLKLNEDDYERVCQIPQMKGANFRNLPGVRVGPNNKVELDPDVERPTVKSGKPLVPDYALKFVRGTSTKPFGRLWWDEHVLTVVTRAEPHNQIILHPNQNRVLTIRENARLQGFPDWYRLSGPVKERYTQVGNAVAFPVSISLGYMMAKASRGEASKEAITGIPIKFPQCLSELSG